VTYRAFNAKICYPEVRIDLSLSSYLFVLYKSWGDKPILSSHLPSVFNPGTEEDNPILKKSPVDFKEKKF